MCKVNTCTHLHRQQRGSNRRSKGSHDVDVHMRPHDDAGLHRYKYSNPFDLILSDSLLSHHTTHTKTDVLLLFHLPHFFLTYPLCCLLTYAFLLYSVSLYLSINKMPSLPSSLRYLTHSACVMCMNECMYVCAT